MIWEVIARLSWFQTSVALILMIPTPAKRWAERSEHRGETHPLSGIQEHELKAELEDSEKIRNKPMFHISYFMFHILGKRKRLDISDSCFSEEQLQEVLDSLIPTSVPCDHLLWDHRNLLSSWHWSLQEICIHLAIVLSLSIRDVTFLSSFIVLSFLSSTLETKKVTGTE